jgi:hypothetical protein
VIIEELVGSKEISDVYNNKQKWKNDVVSSDDNSQRKNIIRVGGLPNHLEEKILLLQLFISPKGGPTFLGFFYTDIIYRLSIYLDVCTHYSFR